MLPDQLDSHTTI